MRNVCVNRLITTWSHVILFCTTFKISLYFNQFSFCSEEKLVKTTKSTCDLADGAEMVAPPASKSLTDVSNPDDAIPAQGTNQNTFDNPKEKQCYDMYRKMNKKGVAISFDTILRGMLTPTEYRLRRKSSLAFEPNDNDDDNRQTGEN